MLMVLFSLGTLVAVFALLIYATYEIRPINQERFNYDYGVIFHWHADRSLRAADLRRKLTQANQSCCRAANTKPQRAGS